MCFRSSLSVKYQQLAKKYGKLLSVIEMYQEAYGEKYHVQAFNNPLCPVITADENIQAYRWGLIPNWAKKEKIDEIRKMTYNARSETVFEKASFRKPILYNRCIIPSTGYFEHRHNEDGSKTPYFIHMKDFDVFSFGGVFDKWTNPETKEEIYTFSIITTPANELTGWIHNGGANSKRMPLILHPDEEQNWLLPELNNQDIKSFMQTYPANEMAAYAIRNDFIKKKPDDPTILDAA